MNFQHIQGHDLLVTEFFVAKWSILAHKIIIRSFQNVDVQTIANETGMLSDTLQVAHSRLHWSNRLATQTLSRSGHHSAMTARTPWLIKRDKINK